jgi:hypothetical protein
VGHVAAPELPSQEGRARSHRTRGSTRAHLFKEVRIEAEGHVTVAELTSARRGGPGPRDTWWCRSPPLPSWWWSEATAHVTACGCTPCSLSWLRACMWGYPVFRVSTEAPGPPQERLRTRRWGQNPGASLGYLKLFSWQSTAGPREVQELEVQQRPSSALRNIDDGLPGGVRAGGPGASTINAKKCRRRTPWGAGGRSGSGYHWSWRHWWWAPWGCWRQVQQQPPPKLKTSMAGPLVGAGSRSSSGHHRSWISWWRTPRGCWRQVLQRPPPKLKTSMAGPLLGAVGIFDSGSHRSWRRPWRAPYGVLVAGPVTTTTEVEDVDGTPPWRCW